VAAQLERATRAGATLRADEPALSWRADGAGVEVTTARESYRAARLLLAAGAWLAPLIESLALPLAVTRQPAFWFEPAGDVAALEPGRFPVWICEDQPGRYLYGFPRHEGRIKLARHLEGERSDPDRMRREIEPGEAESVREAARRFLPEALGPLLSGSVCLYTTTPDGHFIVDRHPEHPQVTIASPCSGHGFKFASAMGEVLADLLDDAPPRFDLSLFRLARFVGG
jgi:sarcosine oxidase